MKEIPGRLKQRVRSITRTNVIDGTIRTVTLASNAYLLVLIAAVTDRVVQLNPVIAAIEESYGCPTRENLASYIDKRNRAARLDEGYTYTRYAAAARLVEQTDDCYDGIRPQVMERLNRHVLFGESRDEHTGALLSKIVFLDWAAYNTYSPNRNKFFR